ncbi:MAG: Vps62-related protein [Candidatus Bathyarchaeota archaeon]|nr:Vps62-related protein [Candidatus Bathyarchaeota archaeon]
MRIPACFLAIIFLAGLLIFSPHQGVIAQDDLDNDGILDLKERQLESLYVPYLHFAAGEKFFPTVVSYHIDNSVLYLKSSDTDTLIDSSPTIASISLYQTGDYYLDNVLGASEEIAEDYEQKKEGLGYTVYSRVTLEGEYFVIQYWFFYAFNLGSLNQHEGDWEMIEIVLDPTETALYAVYSQHFSGERASWNDVEKVDETHPRVYVALGSHANYFRQYQGKLGLENDVVGNAFTLEPDDLQLVLLGEKGSGNHPPSQDWLEYGGKWGNWAELADISLGGTGPRGPGHGENAEKWSDPISWGSDAFFVNQTWFTLSFVAFNFLYIFAGIIAILAAIKVWRIVKRKRQGKLNLMKIMRSKWSVGVVLGIVGIALYLVALFLPWYVVRGNIQTTLLESVGETDLVLIDGVNGLRVNTLQSDQGLTQLFGLGIPFAIILLTSVVLNLLDLIGVEKAKSLSRTYIMSGITSLIPVIIVLVCIILLTGLITPFANAMGGGTVPTQIDEMAKEMASSPITGEYRDTLDSYGILRISWGLGIGSYLFIAAAITKLAAGIIVRKAVGTEKQETKENQKS